MEQMKPGKISQTAQGAAALRAIETYRSKRDRLFEDPLAHGFLEKPAWRVILKLFRFSIFRNALLKTRERQFPGVIGGLLCRTRFIDDTLSHAIASGVDQVVILGAGFDSRAYRIPGIDHTQVFEVDHPATQAWKQVRLKKMLGVLPPHVRFVAIDFNQQTLSNGLVAENFRKDARTFFIWEGVTQYITPEAVDATFRAVSQFSAIGSEIVFTYIHRGVLDGSLNFQGIQRAIAMARRQDEPWIFGFEPAKIDQYMITRGLTIVDHVGASEYTERYLKPLGRHMAVFQVERVVLAKISK
jgi:methyltransferase (TIGR00027 family)